MIARLGRRPNRQKEDGEHSRTTFEGKYYVDPHHRRINGEMAKVIQLPVERYDGTKTKGFDVSHIIRRGETKTVKAAMEWKPKKKYR